MSLTSVGYMLLKGMFMAAFTKAVEVALENGVQMEAKLKIPQASGLRRPILEMVHAVMKEFPGSQIRVDTWNEAQVATIKVEVNATA